MMTSFSSIGLILVLYTLINKIRDTARPTPSAMMKENHTPFMPTSFAIMYAVGINTKSCLAIETIIVPIPYPVAWNEEPKPIEIAADTKQREMILSAGTPSLYISSVAEKRERRASGKRLKRIVPITIIPTAMRVPIHMVDMTLFFFLAP